MSVVQQQWMAAQGSVEVWEGQAFVEETHE